MKSKKEIQYCLNFLKVVAVLLVYNSHCDDLYPEKIRFLATGGAIGNALFFAMSGYFLKVNDSFGKFIWAKIKRLYPFTIIMAIFYVIWDYGMPKSFLEGIEVFIWPTFLWFIGALMLFYTISYYLIQYHIINRFVIYSVVIFGIYFLYYFLLVDRTIWSVEAKGITSVAGFFKLIYYFYIFTIAICSKKSNISYLLKNLWR